MRAKIILFLTLVAGLVSSTSIHAEQDAQSRADEAVAVTLFEYEGSDEFASYRVNEDGFVDIVFAQNMPDKVYSELLDKLQNHPHIDGVLAGRGGPVCSIDSWKAENIEKQESE